MPRSLTAAGLYCMGEQNVNYHSRTKAILTVEYVLWMVLSMVSLALFVTALWIALILPSIFICAISALMLIISVCCLIMGQRTEETLVDLKQRRVS